MKDKARFVLPVFYKVDSSDVRKLKRSYGKAMTKHNACLDLDKWKASLHQVANLSGFHYEGYISIFCFSFHLSLEKRVFLLIDR